MKMTHFIWPIPVRIVLFYNTSIQTLHIITVYKSHNYSAAPTSIRLFPFISTYSKILCTFISAHITLSNCKELNIFITAKNVTIIFKTPNHILCYCVILRI